MECRTVYSTCNKICQQITKQKPNHFNLFLCLFEQERKAQFQQIECGKMNSEWISVYKNIKIDCLFLKPLPR